MRRKAGVGAVHRQKLTQEKYKDKGTELQELQLEEMSRQLEVFRGKLEEFASRHRQEIRKNPQFRRQFQEMCASIGVDPLASGKGFWSELLGVGDFYYELGVQIVEVCLSTSHRNGGLITLDELRQRLIKARGKSKHHQEITNDDLLRAIKKLRVLGNGFGALPIGNGKYLIQSIPGELSMDHTAILQQAEETACISVSRLKQVLGWEEDRAKRSLNYLVKEGLAWVDRQNSREVMYWFPSLFAACVAAK